ncbi:hypothetical protein [Pectobacterium carotovorum]|uniref:hypothetical protein n=1 Tax=Pectobacterium carotovorum TaxID=554 RepID=UPI00111539A5|nr:hypothetical protein [Pectobacterium carotovorum]
MSPPSTQPNPASDRALAVFLPHHLSSSPAYHSSFSSFYPRFVMGKPHWSGASRRLRSAPQGAFLNESEPWICF